MNFLPSEPTFNVFILIFLIVGLLAFAGLLISIYGFLSKWLTFLQRDSISGSEKIKQKAQVEATRILDDARKKSMEIVSESSSKAQVTLASMDKMNTDSKSKLGKQLNTLVDEQTSTMKSASDDLVNFYKDSLTKQKKESVDTLQSVSHSIEEELLHEVDEFKDLLRKETIDTQKGVEEKIQQEYSKISSEIDSYKMRQIKAIDQTIYDILHDVSKKVLGEALSMEEHQELIIKALVEAKENNVFSKS